MLLFLVVAETRFQDWNLNRRRGGARYEGWTASHGPVRERERRLVSHRRGYIDSRSFSGGAQQGREAPSGWACDGALARVKARIGGSSPSIKLSVGRCHFCEMSCGVRSDMFGGESGSRVRGPRPKSKRGH